MKKLLALILSVVLVLGATSVVGAAPKSTVTVNVDGNPVELVAYNINDNNYFKLRDIANILKGTQAQFDVVWNQSAGAVEIVTGTPYSTEEELTTEVLINPDAITSSSPVYKNGARIVMAAYNIGGNNFLKLRDIAAAIDFGVTWSPESGIGIDTNSKYEFPESSSAGFSINPEYLSLFGKTKGEVDALFGQGQFWREWALMVYDNGIQVSYNTYDLYGDLGDDDLVWKMYIPVDKLFYNCPDELTKEQLRSAFIHCEEGYSEEEMTETFVGYYFGYCFMFYPEWGITKGDTNIFVYEAPAGETYTQTIKINNEAVVAETKDDKTLYYEYATRRHPEFVEQNAGWGESENYYNFADVDRDDKLELLVKKGAGITVYKVIDGEVQRLFCDPLPESSGIYQYCYATYQGQDYIAYFLGNSSELIRLYILDGDSLVPLKESMVITGVEWLIDNVSVSEEEYNAYKAAIEFPQGVSLEELK